MGFIALRLQPSRQLRQLAILQPRQIRQAGRWPTFNDTTPPAVPSAGRGALARRRRRRHAAAPAEVVPPAGETGARSRHATEVDSQDGQMPDYDVAATLPLHRATRHTPLSESRCRQR